MCAFWNYLVTNPIIITGVLVIAGWVVGHYFSKKRDLANKKREIRLSYLIAAFRQIENASNRPQSHETESKLESGIADIMLFGTKEQVILANELANGLAKDGVAPTIDLLKNLRADLRNELNLESVDVWNSLRFHLDESVTKHFTQNPQNHP